MAGAGPHLTPREMAKFGWLYLNRGAWDGRQIVPEAWVADSTRERSRGDFHLHPAGRDMAYGYLWWIDQFAPSSFTANGFGGQLITVLPRQDMVIVTATSPRPQIAAAMRRYVLPAIRE